MSAWLYSASALLTSSPRIVRYIGFHSPVSPPHVLYARTTCIHLFIVVIVICVRVTRLIWSISDTHRARSVTRVSMGTRRDRDIVEEVHTLLPEAAYLDIRRAHSNVECTLHTIFDGPTSRGTGEHAGADENNL